MFSCRDAVATPVPLPDHNRQLQLDYFMDLRSN